MSPLLDIKNLEVAFDTKDGLVRAVTGISYSMEQGTRCRARVAAGKA